MRRYWPLVALVAVACGGSANVMSPSGHTSVATVTPPTPPSGTTVTYPTLTGTWAGTATIVSSLPGTDFNSCSATVNVVAQAAGEFFGVLSLSGGTVAPCSQSGNAFGSVGTTGAVSLEFSLSGDPTQCLTVSDTGPLTGVVANDTLTLTMTTHRTCTSSTTLIPQDGVQSVSLSLRR